jgi:hypothetical protein
MINPRFRWDPFVERMRIYRLEVDQTVGFCSKCLGRPPARAIGRDVLFGLWTGPCHPSIQGLCRIRMWQRFTLVAYTNQRK